MTPFDVRSFVRCLKWCSVCKCVYCYVHREDRESRFLSSKMAIVAAFRSWSGKDFLSAKELVLYHLYFGGEYSSNVSFCIQGLSIYAKQGILESSL